MRDLVLVPVSQQRHKPFADPDIEVDITPQDHARGADPQLERAIKEVLKRIKQDPKRLPKRPADPVKTD